MTVREMDELIDLFRTDGPPAGPATHGLYFILPKPDPDKFQFVFVPLARRELSISELTDLFLRGFVSPGTPRENIQAWIFDRLRDRALDTNWLPCFQVVSCPSNGKPVERTVANVTDIPTDEPIRLICRPEWFRRGYGTNPGAGLYFGGRDATHQGVFYGVDGTGGRFPLRPPRDRTVPTRESPHPAPVDSRRSDLEKTRPTSNADQNDLQRTEGRGEPEVPLSASTQPAQVYDIVAKLVKTNLISVSSQEDPHETKTPGEPLVPPSAPPQPAPVDQKTDLENKGEEKGSISGLRQDALEQREQQKMPTSTEDKLLIAVYRYAHRQGENFTTAAFVHLLRHLLRNDPKAGAEFVKRLTGWMDLEEAEAVRVGIEIQTRRKGQQPDIRIYAPTGRTAIIEVKLWAKLSNAQLNYARADAKTSLVVLAMKPLKLGMGLRRVLWSEVEEWLEHPGGMELQRSSKYLLSQLSAFLAGRRVSGPNDGGLTFLFPVPTRHRFQHALVPLVRKDLSLNGLIDLFLKGVPATEPEHHKVALRKLFGEHGSLDAARTEIRDWIINILITKGLDPGCDAYSAFKHVCYPGNGTVENLTRDNIEAVDDDVPIRIRKKQGELFADGSTVRHFALLSNRWELKAARLIEWHREKAGTIEFVHDVIKNDLGGGVLPSKYFRANAAWLRLAVIAHNVLQALKRLSLPAELLTARPKRLRFLLFTMPGRLVHHARRLMLREAALGKWAAAYGEGLRLLPVIT